MTLPEGGGEGAKVEPRCQRGQAGDVIVVSEVGIGDSENGEGGAVREGHGELRGEGEEGSELGELRYGGEEGGEVINGWRKRFREGDTNEKRKKMWDNEKSENKNNIFLLLLDTRQKVVQEFSELQVFEYLSCLSPSHFLNQT